MNDQVEKIQDEELAQFTEALLKGEPVRADAIPLAETVEKLACVIGSPQAPPASLHSQIRGAIAREWSRQSSRGLFEQLSRLFRARTVPRWAWAAISVMALVAIVSLVLVQPDLRNALLGTVGQPPTPTATAPGPTPTPTARPPQVKVAPTSPVMFIENIGQFDPAVRFVVQGNNRMIWLTEDGLQITLVEQPIRQARTPTLSTILPIVEPPRSVNLKLSFPGSNPHPQLEPFDPLDIHISYFTGNDPVHWRSDVPVWGGVRYKDIYPGLDLELVGGEGGLQQRILARPGADSGAVQVKIQGANQLSLASGGVRVSTDVGDFTLPLLAAETSGAPAFSAGNAIVSPFTSPLVQPTRPSAPPHTLGGEGQAAGLLYSSFLGGGHGDWGYSVAADSLGCAYITGGTFVSDFITATGAFVPPNGSVGQMIAFVAKLSQDGRQLEYITFIGGSQHTWGYGIAVDQNGHAYVTGGTNSADFPITPGAYDATCGSDGACNPDVQNRPRYDAFIVKLNATGSALLYSTFAGGSGTETASSIAVDNAAQVYIAGNTQSLDLPVTAGAFDSTHNDLNDVFVMKLNPAGAGRADLMYATYFGGSGNDSIGGIALDSVGSIYLAGGTDSLDLPTTPGAYNTSYGSSYATFIVRLAPKGAGGADLAYATFLGRDGADYGRAIAVDKAGYIYVTGDAFSDNFPATPNAFDTTFNGGTFYGDAYVVKLKPAGAGNADLVYATFLGGRDSDYGRAIDVDDSGYVYVTGDTFSDNFPVTPGALDATFNGNSGSSDIFVAKLNPDGSRLVYSTFIGGTGSDHGNAIAVDQRGDAVVAGDTVSANFPTANAYDADYNGMDDAVVFKLCMPVGHSISGRVTDNAGEPVANAVILDNAGGRVATDSSGYYTLSDLAAGVYTITLVRTGYMSPTPVRIVSLPPDVTNQNFILYPARQVYLPLVMR